MVAKKTIKPHGHKKDEKFVVAIELGSSQAKIGVAGYDANGTSNDMTVYNMASLPTIDSVRYGRIVNIREVTNTLLSLLDEVDKKYPIENRSILGTYISIGGRSLKSQRISARIVLPTRREITEDLITRLQKEAVQSLNISGILVCVEPVRYSVDNIPNPRPVGALGQRLAGEFTAVTCNKSNMDDLVDVLVDRVGLQVRGISVRPIALANLVLTNAEKNAGCMLLDFGAETITVSIYRKYALQYLATIPIGSRLITRDLASIMALTEDKAELIKIQRGNALPQRDDTVDDPRAQNAINEIISARLADIVANIAAQPEFAQMSVLDLPAGIVLAGGGSKLRNFGKLLEKQTGLKVRIATMPHGITITDPDLSATDNLDLIALLKESVDDALASKDDECVSPSTGNETLESDYDPEEIPEEEPERVNEDETEDEVLISFEEEKPLSVKREQRKERKMPSNSFDKDDDEPLSHQTNTKVIGTYSEQDDEDENDDLIFEDSASAERQRTERERRNQKKLDKERARALKYAAQQRKAAERKLMQQKRKEKEETEKEQKPQKTSKGGLTLRIERIINRVTDYITDFGDDDSGELYDQ